MRITANQICRNLISVTVLISITSFLYACGSSQIKPVVNMGNYERSADYITAQGTDLRTLYVSNNGSDFASGLSESDALASIQKAANMSKPGDTILIMNGTYTNAEGKHLAFIETSGTAKHWIRYAPYPGHKPLLKVSSHGGFYIHGASYLVIENLTLEGPQDSVTLEYALAEKENTDNPLTSNTGIAVKARKLSNDQYRYAHHLIIQGNETYKFNCNGIGIMRADYILVQNNVAYENAFYSPWACSGISTLGNWNFDDRTDIYRAVIRNNKSFRNHNYVEFWQQKKFTDGNGIIADLLATTQTIDGYNEPFNGYALIENNIIFENGGRGINMYHSQNVDIVNNTTWHNGQHDEINTELGIGKSNNVRMLNNIFVARPGAKMFLYYGSKNIDYNNNVFHGYEDFGAPLPENAVLLDPKLLNPAQQDFRLQAESPAIDSATTESALNDFFNQTRVDADMGAVESR